MILEKKREILKKYGKINPQNFVNNIAILLLCSIFSNDLYNVYWKEN